MIGMSLPYKWLLENKNDMSTPAELLPKLWERGVRSIEIRAVSAGGDPVEVLRVASLLWDHGFNVTVHSTCKTAENAVAEVLEPLSLMVANMRQSELTVTLHPIVGDNAEMLLALSDFIIEKGYPVKIALENNRKMPDNSDGDSVALVLDAVTRANRKNVGICFDMGHLAWYADKFTDTPDMLPPKEFLSRVIHTHIHAYEEGTTHYPIYTWRKPFSRYIEALAPKYYGVYNVELSPSRFEHIMSAEEGYLISADTLRSNLPALASVFDGIRENYDNSFKDVTDMLEKKDGCYFHLSVRRRTHSIRTDLSGEWTLPSGI